MALTTEALFLLDVNKFFFSVAMVLLEMQPSDCIKGTATA